MIGILDAMPINFRQLEVFRAVAEARSFTQASHRLFISQSTVSQHVRELEDSLNVTLFDRNRRNVSPTTAGENLLEHGRNIFRMLEEAEDAAKTVKDPYRGKLSFGCASTTLLYHLPAILMEYTKQYPNVELNITGGTIQDVALRMWSGALDLALVVLPLSSPALEKMVLFEESRMGAAREPPRREKGRFPKRRPGRGKIHSSPPGPEHAQGDRSLLVQRAYYAQSRHRAGGDRGDQGDGGARSRSFHSARERVSQRQGARDQNRADSA